MSDTLMTESDLYFQKLKKDRTAIETTYQHILSVIDHALPGCDYETLLSLIPYIEEGEGHITLECFDKVHRLLRILHITRLELKYHKPLFSMGCSSAQELMDKYMLTMFSFRRILFHISDDSVNEAVCYLRQHPVSALAAYSMTQDELLLPDQAFYENLASIYLEIWSTDETRQFFALVNSK